MTQVRVFLIFAWLFLAFLLWEAWQRDYAVTPPPAEPAAVGDAPIPQPTADLPSSAQPLVPATRLSEAAGDAVAPVIVRTDLLRIELDPRGASVRRAELLGYPQSTDREAAPVELLSPDGSRLFVAQSGWVSSEQAAPNHQSLFAAPRSKYTLAPEATELVVPLTWTGEDGLTVTRNYVFSRGSYAIAVRDEIHNGGTGIWRASNYRQLLREPPVIVTGYTHPESYSFVGSAWYSAVDKFNKIAFDDFASDGLADHSATGGWVAMLQHYFFAAWIAQADEPVTVSTAQLNGRYLIRQVGPTIEVAAGASQISQSRLYVGPKLQKHLAEIAPGLELTVDYGVLTMIAEPLFWLLSAFHALVGNWGIAIILLVVLLKAVFFKLSEAQYKSMAKMRAVQPRIEALKERYGEDRQKFNEAMMELYKKEKINPMGGCLPILVTIPVFIALYWVLLESVELRQAPFLGWIHNLSAPDPYFVLPVLNLVTMWLTQKLSPAPGMDPLQRKMMQAMPLVFGVLFAFFPAGLVLYWTVNGGLGLLQQWIITRRHG